MSYSGIKKIIPIEEMKAELDYDPETGLFRWKIAKHKVRIWAIAGGMDPKGYILINFYASKHRAHRVAFAFMTGLQPVDQIDHINGVKSDNRWVNLREATNSQNQMNTDAPSHNTSGVRGVSFDIQSGRYIAFVRKDKKWAHHSRHDRFEDAVEARQAAEVRLFGEFAKVS